MSTRRIDNVKITAVELGRMAIEQVPIAGQLGFIVDEIKEGEVVVRVPYQDSFVRPGGTIAGPVLMALADFAMWGAVMSLIGRVELAVTTNLNINFLKRPTPGDVVATSRVLKLGKRLAVGDVFLHGTGSDQGLVAHATVTYSIPPSA